MTEGKYVGPVTMFFTMMLSQSIKQRSVKNMYKRQRTTYSLIISRKQASPQSTNDYDVTFLSNTSRLVSKKVHLLYARQVWIICDRSAFDQS